MIIFDTSALRGLHRGNPKFDLLRALKYSGSLAAGIPWMVREELVAKQVLEYTDAYDRAEAALSELNRKIRWPSMGHVPPRETERAKEYWRDQYEEVLITLETSGENARLALAREAYCEKPAKIDHTKKGGARDAAIWLSVISYLEENPDETVYFVSGNVHDFGDGEDYPAPMADDLRNMEGRLFMLASFDEVISRFTEEIAVDIEHVKGLLADLGHDSLAAIGASAQAGMKGGVFNGTRINGGSFTNCSWHDWIIRPSVILRNIVSASGHKIVESEWYTATVDWILVGFAAPFNVYTGSISPRDITDLPQIACQWRTKILFSPGKAQALTVVDSWPPSALFPEDRGELEPLIDAQMTANKTETSALFLARLLWDNVRSPRTQGADVIFGDTNSG